MICGFHCKLLKFTRIKPSCISSLRYHSSGTVRVRFAPSPTGFLHLGSIRTAFYNFVFAKKNAGSFLLRIEDTDQSRLVVGALESMVNTLNWMDLKPAEPLVIQSERLPLYQARAQALVDSGHAYRCFCSETRLELLKKHKAKNREKFGYDRRCYHLSDAEVKEKMDAQTPYVIRLKFPDETIEFEDLVFGGQSRKLLDMDSDPVVLKSDGFPTYHLANVVDDKEMNISHVLRGAEWLDSTPKHILLYKAFGWTPPKFAHLPLMLNKDGSKLSKRENSLRLDYLREAGYLPEALCNYLRVVGGGFCGLSTNELLTFDEIIDSFSIGDILTHPCKLDMDKLNYFNRIALSNYTKDKMTNLIAILRDNIRRKHGQSVEERLSDDYLSEILDWSKTRIYSVDDLVKELDFIWSAPQPSWDLKKMSTLGDLKEILLETIKLVDKSDGSPFAKSAKKYAESKGLKYSKYMKFIRVAITNNEDGVPIADLLHLLGKDECSRRLNLCIEYINENSTSNESQVETLNT